MIERIRIASPCSANWEQMAGDDRVRHCTECRLNVYNFAAMTRSEAERVIEEREGRLRAAFWRATRVASVALAAIVSMRTAKAQSSAATPQSAPVVGNDQQMKGLSLTVMDPSGGVVSGAEVRIWNVITGEFTLAKTDSRGQINRDDLPPGPYGIVIHMQGFKRVQQDVTVPSEQVLTLQLSGGGNVIINPMPIDHPRLEEVQPPQSELGVEPLPEMATVGVVVMNVHRNPVARFFHKLRRLV
jgi:Carboxypeptidase regulatory-like domain